MFLSGDPWSVKNVCGTSNRESMLCVYPPSGFSETSWPPRSCSPPRRPTRNHGLGISRGSSRPWKKHTIRSQIRWPCMFLHFPRGFSLILMCVMEWGPLMLGERPVRVHAGLVTGFILGPWTKT